MPVIFSLCKTKAHCSRATIELLCQETPDFIAPNVWPPNSPDLNPLDYEISPDLVIHRIEIWAVMQRRIWDKSTVWMNWNGGWSMSGAVLNSRFLDDAIDQWRGRHRACVHAKRVSMLKEDISSTDCELTMLILSTSVTLNVTSLTFTSLIMKSCQQRCSFYKVVH